MPGSNSLISNTYQGNALFDRADIRNLKVRDNLLLNNQINLDNYTPDDALLVLITLYIQNASLYSDKIVFTIDNLRLTQWDNRTLNSLKQHRRFTNHTNEDAKLILQGLFDKDVQGKYNATDNPPNAFLNTILNFDQEHYITITGFNLDNNTITLNFQSEEGSPEIIEQKSVDLRVIIDTFERYAFGGSAIEFDGAFVVLEDGSDVFVEGDDETFRFDIAGGANSMIDTAILGDAAMVYLDGAGISERENTRI